MYSVCLNVNSTPHPNSGLLLWLGKGLQKLCVACYASQVLSILEGLFLYSNCGNPKPCQLILGCEQNRLTLPQPLEVSPTPAAGVPSILCGEAEVTLTSTTPLLWCLEMQGQGLAWTCALRYQNFIKQHCWSGEGPVLTWTEIMKEEAYGQMQL